MTGTRNPARHGDIFDVELFIRGKKVTSHMNHINIFQDMFSPFWSAVVSIDDSSNILMNIPIRPGDDVTLIVSTKSESILDGEKTYSFIIYKIDNKVQKGQMHLSYNIFCASIGFILNQEKRVQKTYSNLLPEAMVGSIVGEFLKGKLVPPIDPSDYNYHVIIPNWSPYVACWWIAKLAIKDNRADYFFWMHDFDEYRFRSLEEIYKGEVGFLFQQKPANFRDEAGDFDTDYSIMILKYNIDHYDGMGNLGSGYYRNKLLSYDVINKKLEEKDFKYGDDIPIDEQMKPWVIYDRAETAHVGFLPMNDKLHEKYPTINNYVQKWHGSRLTRLMKMEQDKLQFQILGGAESWKILGDLCTVELYSHQDQESNLLDKHFGGEYVCSHVMHHITTTQYFNNLEMIKIRHEEKMI